MLVLNKAPLAGQTGNTAYLEQLQINQALDPPQDILSEKSLVLISAPADAALGEWKQMASELQAFFAEEGVDAVAYFNVNRQFTIPDVSPEIPKLITDRKISHLIFLIMGAEGQESIIGIGPFNGKPTFYDRGATFWSREFTDLEGVFNELGGLFKTGAFPRTNLLVNESPEFFDMTKPSFAANYASFPPELPTRRIAVPTLVPMPAGAGSHWLNSDHFFNPEKNAETVVRRNAALEAMIADSLFNMERIDLRERTEALLRRDGFTHALYFVDSDSEHIYDLFRYKNREETDAKRLVKFFLRDLRNRNVFLGRSWDASPDWQQALEQFLAQMQKELPSAGG